jgi:hypothetical protein
VFLPALLITGAAGFIRIVWSAVGVDLIYQLILMITWTGLVGYSLGVLFSYFYLGRDVLLHVADSSAFWVSVRKAAVMGCYLYGYFLLSMILNASRLAQDAGPSWFSSFAYYLGARLVSILAFLAVTLGVLAIAKLVRSKFLAGAVLMTLFLGITVGQCVILWAGRSGQANSWSIGISSKSASVNQYANITPIRLVSNVEPAFHAPLPYGSVALNLLVGVVCFLVWFVVVRLRDFDFYER